MYKRQELFDAYRQAETLLLEDGAVIPLYFETSYYASGLSLIHIFSSTPGRPDGGISLAWKGRGW